MTDEPLHRQLGLTDDELAQIVDILGREPNPTELAMFSVMWSEHCSYKSSRPHLRRLPSDGDHVILGPGENAGVIDIGDGMSVVVRIESHNHPSFVEPYQGAATGVGGILRDILTMGSRPIATFDSLRFGLPDDCVQQNDDPAKQRWLARGVVAGISGYGNAVGVPTLGGEIVFDPCYAGNPLVNVMALGVMPIEHLQRAIAAGEGNKVVLIGASTGRDGIGGVSVLASAGFSEGDEAKRPSVQVGDPFAEKKVIEACLEIFTRGLTEGVQDLGGAGLSCATSETAAAGGAGLTVDLDEVELREDDMEAFEVFTSESQERMLCVVTEENLSEVLAICDRWEAPARVIGTVDGTGRLTATFRGQPVCDVPPEALAEGIVYDRPLRRPDRIDELAARDPLAELPEVTADSVADELRRLLTSPNLADASWAWRQYDHQLFLNTVVGPGADAAVLRVKGTTRAIAVALEGLGRYGRLDPRTGAALAVAEACRNVAVVGARPMAVVDCMNFGNPEKPEVMWEFSEAVDGIGEACIALGAPVVGGNVSFYNETAGRDIDPTPIVGVVGLIDDLAEVPVGPGFAAAGDVIYVCGTTYADLGGSEWAWWNHDVVCGRPPTLDLDAEAALHRMLAEVAVTRAATAVHDCGLGGVAVTLAEMAMASSDGSGGDLGCDVDPSTWAPEQPLAVALFAETAGRVVCTVAADATQGFEALAAAHGVPCVRVGTVGGGDVLGVPVSELRSLVATDL